MHSTDKLIKIKKTLLDNTLESFQFALALCDKDSAIRYKTKYEDIIYELSLELALNIQKQEYFELFKEIHNAMLHILDSDSQNILTVIILQQEKYIENFTEIALILDQEYPKIEDIKSSELMKKSTTELIEMYEEQKVISHSHYVSRKLSSIGSQTSDIEIAYHLLSKIREDRPDLRRRVLSNIISLESGVIDDGILNYELSHGYTKEDYKEAFEEKQYRTAKEIYRLNITQANTIIESIDSKYEYYFRAFIAHENNDEAGIVKIIEEIDILSEVNKIYNDDYDHILLSIGHIIVEKYPSISHEILSKLYTLWGDSLDLEVAIALSIFKTDADKGLSYILSIEEPYARYIAIEEIAKTYNDMSILMKILPLIGVLEINTWKYEILYILNTKIKVSFEQLLRLTSDIYPYEEINI